MSRFNGTTATVVFVIAVDVAYFVLLALAAPWIWTVLGGAVILVSTAFFVRQILGGKM